MERLHWERALSDLMDHGLAITIAERDVLEAVPAAARPHLLSLVRRAMTTGTPSTVVRYKAPHDTATDRLEGQLAGAPWEISEDGTSFRHHVCGVSHGGYEGPYQSVKAAVDHHRQCTPSKGRHAKKEVAGRE